MPQHRPVRARQAGPVTPLKEVRLRNFKSVRNAHVELRPLTAIVGRNSSGKSTLLQGILALAQSVRRDVAGKSFPLNGELVRLGTFDEVLNFDAASTSGIDIGFTAEFLQRVSGPERGIEREPQHNLVVWDAHLIASRDDENPGQAILDTIEFATRSVSERETVANVSLAVTSITAESSPAMPMIRGSFVFRRGTDVQIEGRVTDLLSGRSSTVDAMSMSGGLPVRVFKTEPRFEVRFRRWWDVVFNALEEERVDARRHTAEALTDEQTAAVARKNLRTDITFAVKHALDSLNSIETFDPESSFTSQLRQARFGSTGGLEVFLFKDRLSQLGEKKRRQLANALNELDFGGLRLRVRERLEEEGADWLDTLTRDEPIADSHQVLQQATSETVALFQQVRYLGPLRAKPQVNYSPGPGQIDLGPEGEFSAAILHANAHRRVLVPLPTGGARPMALGEGLNLWLEELGLASTAQAKDKGRSGIGLYVQPVGRTQSVDLTSVGVGVSQALPVVLLCLIAPPESIILLEQPELHLHPDMQLRLADFLLACVRSGRQIVFETHSEHLVNRLRRRVAEDDSTSTADAIRLLFADQSDGATVYSVSDINEVGGLSTDWPKGFLDVAADESTRLLQQSLAKKRAQSDKNS
jgi:hypothetical protein